MIVPARSLASASEWLSLALGIKWCVSSMTSQCGRPVAARSPLSAGMNLAKASGRSSTFSASALTTGDPLDESRDVGPVIDAASADRIGEWIDEARAAGARILAGGVRHGSVWEPTVIEGAPSSARVNCREVFAPLLSLTRYTDVHDAIAAANDSEFGLQAGIFTYDQRVIDAAVDGIDAGGIIVNDSSTFRVDHMPYGGVKQSGFGREGVRYAIEEMTEMKLVAYNRTVSG